MSKVTSIVLIFFASFYFSTASEYKLRGVQVKKNDHPEERQLQGRSCEDDLLAYPLPTEPCGPNQNRIFDLRSCSWLCTADDDAPQVRSGSTSEPMCPQGEFPILNYNTKQYDCINPDVLCPGDKKFLYDNAKQTFACVNTLPNTASVTANSNSVSVTINGADQGHRSDEGSSSSTISVTTNHGGCQFDPLAYPKPSRCPLNQAAFFNKWSCVWICRYTGWSTTRSSEMNSSPTPIVLNCPSTSVIFFDTRHKTYKCTEQPSCDDQQYLVYDTPSLTYYCKFI